jgi:TrmH family RNA methyltransferase
MLTKGKIKSLQNLKIKKERDKRGIFLVEGEKSVVEVLKSDFFIEEVFATNDFIETHKDLLNAKDRRAAKVEEGELEAVGSFEHNTSAVAVVKQKKRDVLPEIKTGLTLVLDDIRDPGNLGTIIRIADWYGIKQIIASVGSVDMYNNKAIAASMGSFTRIPVFYTNLFTFLKGTKLPVFGAYLEGKDVHQTTFPKDGILLIGNESNGISPELKEFVSEKITIGKFGKAESLNASVATGILIDNWMKALR